jgi:hypothetical protein
MAMTALMIETDTDVKYIQIATSREEEQYHTELRKESAKRNQLITSHSTDPEWNPENYDKRLETNEK